MATRFLILCLFSYFLSPLVVDADDSAEEKEIISRAKTFFARGEMLFRTGNYLEAAEAFKMAYETSPYHAVTGNIAICYDKAGMWPLAVTYYRIFLADSSTEAQHGSKRERLNELEQRVGELEIECAEPGCQIRVDGAIRGEAPIKVVLLPGRHRIEALVDENLLVSEETEVKARHTSKIELKVEPPESVQEKPVANPEQTAIDHEDSPVLGPGFWASASLTGASGVSLLIFGLLAVDAQDKYKASDWMDRDAKQKGEQYMLTTNIMIGLTAAAAVATVVFGIYDFRDAKRHREVVVIGPGPGWGLSLTKHF